MQGVSEQNRLQVKERPNRNILVWCQIQIYIYLFKKKSLCDTTLDYSHSSISSNLHDILMNLLNLTNNLKNVASLRLVLVTEHAITHTFPFTSGII